MNIFRHFAAAFGALLLTIAHFALAADIQTQPVRFAKGSSSATIQARIRGYQTIDYTLRARAGQTMSVKLTTKHGANYFNVLPPDSNDVAIFIGQNEGNEWSATLPQDGEYKLRVYLMRSAARRNEVANYTLTVSITGTPAHDPGKAPAGDALVAGTPYHATGALPCVLHNTPAAQCAFGVIRGKPGHAEVHVTQPGGVQRVLRFAGDTVSSGSDKVKAARQADLWTVDVNDVEHYRIPLAVIAGG